MGSVKDLTVVQSPELNKQGKGQFTFSDRYSVFDWGEMPDHIDKKGTALAIISAYFLEKLNSMNIKTHYLGINSEGESKHLNDLDSASNKIDISLVRVVKPILENNQYDYSVYENEKNNFLIPFEIIYRNRLPENSSVFKRLKNKDVTPEYFGLKEFPTPGQILEQPIYDISTKLEVDDRYITWDEAKTMAYLSDEEIEKIKNITQQVNKLITEEMAKLDLINEDGKIELAFDENRNLMIVDTLGTLDECRFKYKDYPISKEMARIYYRNTDWYKKVEEAKKQDRFTWKEIVGEDPQSLPDEFAHLFSAMYKTIANQITGKDFFPDTPDLPSIINGIEKYMK